MRLYSGLSPDFIRDTTRNQIAEKLKEAFFSYYRYQPAPAEVNSWRNSLRAMKDVLEISELHDHGVLLEYQLPLSSKRIDCILCGRDDNEADEAVVVELKQWERCEPAEADKLVRSWVAGRNRELLHPSVQVGQYRQYLEDSHSAFHETANPVRLSSCSYLHNYLIHKDDPIVAPKFEGALKDSPLFGEDGADALAAYLKTRLALGQGQPVLQRVEESRFRPSRKLMDHVATTIKSRSPWILLDEQLVVFEQIRATVKSGLFGRQKQVVIVRGGPGTGKSVLALNLMAELMRDGRNAHYATGSKAFTETLWEVMGSRTRAAFKYFNSYAKAEHNEIDVLICDEAHRIRKTSDSRFTRREDRSTKPQVREILDAAKVSVFFVDDRQVVRPNEIGSSEYIRQSATAANAVVSDYELEVQFRCAGSDGFINWVENTIGVRKTANVIWDGSDGFDFRIVGSPEELDKMIRERAGEGYTARVSAGFCWAWSKPKVDGTLVDDVVIGDFKRPWNAKPDSGGLAPGVPSASLWATDPRGLEQLGCVYTVQGFELDYLGVIWGRDLRYDPDKNEWIGDKAESKDSVVRQSREHFVDLVKNTYRVLLSRGMKGCFVHFMDKDTERFVRSRMEAPAVGTELQSPGSVRSHIVFQPRIVVPRKKDRYLTCIPFVPLRIAADAFSDPQAVDEESLEWVSIQSSHALRPGMFVAQVVGKSMEPTIPDGAFCLFRAPLEGTRQAKTVLVQLHSEKDPETGERYTVKRYESEKLQDGDSWRHGRILLKPVNPEFAPIVLSPADESEVSVIAELVEVLGRPA